MIEYMAKNKRKMQASSVFFVLTVLLPHARLQWVIGHEGPQNFHPQIDKNGVKRQLSRVFVKFLQSLVSAVLVSFPGHPFRQEGLIMPWADLDFVGWKMEGGFVFWGRNQPPKSLERALVFNREKNGFAIHQHGVLKKSRRKSWEMWEFVFVLLTSSFITKSCNLCLCHYLTVSHEWWSVGFRVSSTTWEFRTTSSVPQKVLLWRTFCANSIWALWTVMPRSDKHQSINFRIQHLENYKVHNGDPEFQLRNLLLEPSPNREIWLRYDTFGL